MPMSGPAQATVHKIIAASIMQMFDLEHPDFGILDTDEVAVSFKRHVYVKESSFQAGELRQVNRTSELNLLATSLRQNGSVTSGVLELAPSSLESSISSVETAAMARKLLGSSVAKPNRTDIGVKGPRTVTCDDGTSWLLPPHISFCRESTFLSGNHQPLMLKILLKKGSCQVNGRTIVRRDVSVRHLCEHINKQTVLALRALSAELFPVYGPAQDQVHRSVAARILCMFDKENPSSDILDDTVVNIRIQRHQLVRESSFVAGDLRVENRNDLAILTERFRNDPAVISGELLPATAPVTCTAYAPPLPSGSATARGKKEKSKDREEEVSTVRATASDELPDTTLVSKERENKPGEVWRVTNVDDTSPLSLPWGIYSDAKDANGDETMRLKVKLGACWVNGEKVAHAKKMKVVGGVAVNASNIAALRSLRDDFGLGLGASKRVKMIIAAKAFRLWLRTRRGSDFSGSAPVSITDAVGNVLRPIVVATAGELRGVNIERSRVVKELLHALRATGTDAERGSCDRPIPDTPISTKGKKRKRVKSANEATHSSDPVSSTANDPRKRVRGVECGSGNKTARGCTSLGRPAASDGNAERAQGDSAEVLKERHGRSGGRVTLGCSKMDGASPMAKTVVIDLTSRPAASEIEDSDQTDAAGPGPSYELPRGAKRKKRRRSSSSTPAQECKSEERVVGETNRGDIVSAAASSWGRSNGKTRSGKDQRICLSESVQSGGVGERAARERKAEKGTHNGSGNGVAGGRGGVQYSCAQGWASAVIVSASCSSTATKRDKRKNKKGNKRDNVHMDSDQPTVSKAAENRVCKTAEETAGRRRSSIGQKDDGPDHATHKPTRSVEGQSRGAKTQRFGKDMPPSKDKKKRLMQWIVHG
ncbi:expressed unknown protein [Ectocarpus siliculosus]|uniref:Uncharacterized protein n=1 Tax=Ectocarpus siliculosus TaxID=2880 RepID=D7G3G8_ECTSI|nr:expressed unknown protein [Ectocarpus siliculosus]|eukprot:CBJ26966.1 expressed unknown protein [Ectocarpus siliculosus]